MVVHDRLHLSYINMSISHFAHLETSLMQFAIAIALVILLLLFAKSRRLQLGSRMLDANRARLMPYWLPFGTERLSQSLVVS